MKTKRKTRSSKVRRPAKLKKKRSLVSVKKKPKKEYAHAPPLTESELISPLSEDLQDAWIKLRDFATSLGDQRVYTSAKAIMFARRICHFFVRPKKNHLEFTILLPQSIEHPLVVKTMQPTKMKFAHIIKVTHPDHIEEPITDWMRAAFDDSK